MKNRSAVAVAVVEGTKNRNAVAVAVVGGAENRNAVAVAVIKNTAVVMRLRLRLFAPSLVCIKLQNDWK